MSGVNFFNALKQHGTKIAKFKQRRYIEELSKASASDQTLAALYEQVNDGVCTALSLDWLAVCCGKSSTKYETNDHKFNTSITAGSASIQKHFMIDLKPQISSVSNRMGQMAASLGLDFAKFKVPVGGSDGAAIASLVEVLNGSNFGDHFLMVMQMDVGQKKPSHATGIERGMASVYFFDPGLGEYKVSKTKYLDFFQCYFELKAKHWKGSNLIISVYAVSPRA